MCDQSVRSVSKHERDHVPCALITGGNKTMLSLKLTEFIALTTK